jgi:TRAP-type C4-dicarboxylate transport system permease small subunit
MINRALGGASQLLAWVGGVALILMMLHITAEVVGRYFFGTPLHGTVEIVPTYYMVAIVFLPLALIERLNAHIVVELLSKRFPERIQEMQIALVALLSAAYFGAFTWQTWGDALQKFAVREVSLGNVAVTVWPTRFYVPIGCGLITILLVYKAIRLLSGDNSVLARGAHTEIQE